MAAQQSKFVKIFKGQVAWVLYVSYEVLPHTPIVISSIIGRFATYNITACKHLSKGESDKKSYIAFWVAFLQVTYEHFYVWLGADRLYPPLKIVTAWADV
jgi:hypothetical protein